MQTIPVHDDSVASCKGCVNAIIMREERVPFTHFNITQGILMLFLVGNCLECIRIFTAMHGDITKSCEFHDARQQ